MSDSIHGSDSLSKIWTPLDKWDTRFLDLARFISGWSKDPSTKVGAVITADRRIVSVGYNGLPMGVEDTYRRLNNRDVKYKMVVHAERNALMFADRPVRGCTLYTWPFMPCAPCAGLVIQSGITRVVAPYSEYARWAIEFDHAQTMFTEAGVCLVLGPPVSPVTSDYPPAAESPS